MAELLLLTRVLPAGGGGAGAAAPPPPAPRKGGGLWGEPLALGAAQLLLGSLQVALGGALLATLGDPLGAQLGAPLGGGAALLVAGALLVAMAKGPSAGRARAALALAIVASIVSFLALGLQLMLLPHSCPWCHDLGPAAQGALLGTHVLLMTSSLAGAVLAVIGCVAATRARPRAGPAPVVIYQTALPAQGAGPAEATPPAPQ
ncbi:cuticlin 2-like isoform X1 [Oenanthe melanoleuca]|uniref:cuticlin 2-like isoform X1 n=1 Tax=Oenanthe melanoleuca TaxID=2939378 RepID=UPI0024C20482|nr:cuticlin 2-like isoform X1 [Oenanthe melanoleuca]